MQKVVGSSPIIRFPKAPGNEGFFLPKAAAIQPLLWTCKPRLSIRLVRLSAGRSPTTYDAQMRPWCGSLTQMRPAFAAGARSVLLQRMGITFEGGAVTRTGAGISKTPGFTVGSCWLGSAPVA